MTGSMFVLKNGVSQYLPEPNKNYFMNTDVVYHSYINEAYNRLSFDSDNKCILCIGSTEYNALLNVRATVIMDRFPVRLDDAITVGITKTEKEGDISIVEMQERAGYYPVPPLHNISKWTDSFFPFVVDALIKVSQKDTYIGVNVRAKQKGGKVSGYYEKKVLKCSLVVEEVFREPMA